MNLNLLITLIRWHHLLTRPVQGTKAEFYEWIESCD